MTTYNLFLLPGDGIGPEVMAEVEKVTAFFNTEGSLRFEIEKGLVGGCAYDAHGKAISDADIGRANAADAVLLAAGGSVTDLDSISFQNSLEQINQKASPFFPLKIN